MNEKSLKIFLRELKKFCNTFCNDFSTLFDEYPSLINILMLVISGVGQGTSGTSADVPNVGL